jgi:hypothetical protein
LDNRLIDRSTESPIDRSADRPIGRSTDPIPFKASHWTGASVAHTLRRQPKEHHKAMSQSLRATCTIDRSSDRQSTDPPIHGSSEPFGKPRAMHTIDLSTDRSIDRSTDRFDAITPPWAWSSTGTHVPHQLWRQPRGQNKARTREASRDRTIDSIHYPALDLVLYRH